MHSMNYEQADSVRRIKNLADYLVRSGNGEDSLGLSAKELREYSIVRAARAMYDAVECRAGQGFEGLEADAHRALVKIYGQPFSSGSSFYVPREVLAARALGTIPGSKGGYLVPSDIASFIDQLQNASVCLSSGAQLLTNIEQNVSIVKQLSGPTFNWIIPGTTTTATDPVFGQISASPKTVISLTEISAQLQAQGGPVMEAFVRRQLARGLAAGIDQGMLVGPGGVQMLGVTNVPGINVVVGTSLDRPKAIDMQTKANDLNAIVNASAQAYVAPPVTAALLAGRQEFTGVATTLWGGSIAKGSIVGVPALSTKAMTVGSLLFGDFSQLVLVEFGPMQIAINGSDTQFNRGTIAIRALWMVDQIVSEPKSFTLATSVT